MRMGERKREGKRERDGQTKNKQRNTCREWNKPKRCPEKKKGNQPDKTQSQKIPKPRTYDFFPTARAAFIVLLTNTGRHMLYFFTSNPQFQKTVPLIPPPNHPSITSNLQ